MNIDRFLRRAKILALVLSLTLGASYAQAAFVGPPGPAPTCPSGQPGCDAPLNVGSATQVKGSSVGNGAIWSKGSIGTDGGGVFGGSVKVGSTALPNTKAALDVESTTKGVLIPRLTTTERNAITGLSTADQGLTIYNKTTNSLERFDGSTWGPAVTLTAAAGTDGPSFYARKSANMSGPASASASWSAYNYVFDTIVAPNGNTDPCAPSAGNCARGADGRAWGFDPATGVFKPSVPGRYLLTVAVQPQVYNSGGYSQLNLLKNGSSIANTYGYDNGVEYRTDSISVIVDANGTTDYFSVQVQVYNSTIIWSGSTYSYFSGSRIGNPATVNQTVTTTTVNVPSGAVMLFDRQNTAGNQCDPGWVEYTTADGMYMVGAPEGATSGSTVGSRLTGPSSGLLENRTVGYHNHSFSDAGHVHFLPAVAHYFKYQDNAAPNPSNAYLIAVRNDRHDVSVYTYASQCANSTCSSSYTFGYPQATNPYYGSGYHNFIYEGNHNSNTGYAAGTVGYAGGTSGTNAPFVQLLACKKT